MIPLKYFWARTIFVVCISIVFKLFVHLDTAGICYLTRNYIIKERKRGTRQKSPFCYTLYAKAITTPYQTAGVGGGREVPSKGNNKEKKYKPKKKTTTKSKKETRSGGTNVNRLDKRNITKNMLCAAWGDV